MEKCDHNYKLGYADKSNCIPGICDALICEKCDKIFDGHEGTIEERLEAIGAYAFGILGHYINIIGDVDTRECMYANLIGLLSIAIAEDIAKEKED